MKSSNYQILMRLENTSLKKMNIFIRDIFREIL